MNILVTGGSGYIGSILVPKLLLQGYKVTVLDNLMYQQNCLFEYCINSNFNFIKGSICDKKLIADIISEFDVIVLLAAVVGDPICRTDPVMARIINYDAHLSIIRRTSKSQMVIFPSTDSVYMSEKEVTEKSLLAPKSEYAKMKANIEEAILNKGNAIIYRLTAVFGMSPRMRLDLLVNDFVYQAYKNHSIVLFEENFYRNYIHVRDVVSVFLFGIQNYDKMKNEIFNIGLSHVYLTKRQLCEKIKEYILNLYIYSAPISKDIDMRNCFVNSDKIESFGWKPKYTLDDGIKELIKGYNMFRINNFTNI